MDSSVIVPISVPIGKRLAAALCFATDKVLDKI